MLIEAAETITNLVSASENNMAQDVVELASEAEIIQDYNQNYNNDEPISSDDPKAIAKLKQKLLQCEDLQARMKQANKLARKGDREGLIAMGWELATVNTLLQQKGFQSWRLSNNNQEKRRLKERLAELESRQNWTTKKYSVAGVEVEENVEDNRLRIYFPTKPSTEVRNQLKHNGFKWSPNNMAWQRFLNQDSIATAKYLLEKIKNMA